MFDQGVDPLNPETGGGAGGPGMSFHFSGGNPEEIFTLLYPIGHGGFGTVYKAIHNETKTIYAIKIIRKGG